jgi:hypothetical protein
LSCLLGCRRWEASQRGGCRRSGMSSPGNPLCPGDTRLVTVDLSLAGPGLTSRALPRCRRLATVRLPPFLRALPEGVLPDSELVQVDLRSVRDVGGECFCRYACISTIHSSPRPELGELSFLGTDLIDWSIAIAAARHCALVAPIRSYGQLATRVTSWRRRRVTPRVGCSAQSARMA